MSRPHVLGPLASASHALVIRVEGTPQPQGSLRAFAYARSTGTIATRVVSDNPELDTWRQTVAKAARAAIPAGRTCYGGAVDVDLMFALRRPLRRVRELPTARPDIDKLARSVLDALTGVVWLNDAQVVRLSALKRYVNAVEAPHATILVRPSLAFTQRELPGVSNVD